MSYALYMKSKILRPLKKSLLPTLEVFNSGKKNRRLIFFHSLLGCIKKKGAAYYSKNKSPVSGNAIPVLGVKPKRGWYVFWLFFKIDLCSAISFIRSRRELLIDVAEQRSILKNKGVVRILVIFQDRRMFSHIIQKVLARAFD